MLPFLRPHRRKVAIAFGAAVAGMAVGALTPAVEKVILDGSILHHRRPLGPWLAVLVAAGLFGFGTAYVRRYVGGRVALDVQYDLRTAIFERLQRLDFARHDELSTGQLVSRASSDVALVQGLLSFLPIMSGNVVMLAVSLAVMLVLSPLLTVVSLVALPVIGLIALRMRSSVFPASWDAQQNAAEVAGVVEESVTGVRVVKGFGQEDAQLGRLVAAARRLFASRVRMIRVQARYQPALQAVPALAQVGVLALGGWLALHGRITLGTFLAFSTYLVQLVPPVRMLASLVAVAQQARAGVERILDLLDSNPLVSEKPGAPALPPARGEVVFAGVRFGYLRSEPVLDGFDLRVSAGETVALVGPSGSGKSTVALLLPRFYDVAGGTVSIDGVDVRDVTLSSVRSQVGVVFEDSFLFSDTVRANIAFGRPDATDAEVRAAAAAAEADRFIAELPDGYDTVVGERGLTLSGGQRQRLALARALITDPRVLVLDDATASIDAATEADIHATLRRQMEGRTTVLIAHRRSTLRLADRVVVVDRGRVADEGTHDELMLRSPLYRALLTGPGENCEEPVADALAADPATGEPSLGLPAPPVPAAVRPAAGAGGGLGTGRGGMGHGGAMGALLAPTPELLAGLSRLPPADARPAVDVEGAAAHDPRFTLRRFTRPYRRPLAAGLGLVAVDTVLTLAGPYLVRQGVDHGVLRHSAQALWAATLAYLVAVGADWADTRALTRYTGRTAERLLFALRARIFAHLQRLGLDFYDREMAGRIMTRMTTDVESLSTLLQTGLINALVNVLSFVGVAAVLLAMNVQLALATFAVVPFLAGATWWFRTRSDRAYRLARDRIAVVNANLQESLSGVRVSQAFRREDRNIAEFRQVAGEYTDARLGAQRLVATYFPFVILLSDVAAAVVLGVGGHLVTAHRLEAGVLIAFLLYVDQLFAPIQQLSQVFDTWQQARASMTKITELMREPLSTPPRPDAVEPGTLRGDIRLEGVRFRYPTAVHDALRGVDLHVPPGATVAIVGETGAGKSTIVKLVARFYDPTEGRLLIDGVDVRSLDLGGYRRRLGYVPQEPFLFSGTIRDNIAFGRPDATDADVRAAAGAVGAAAFIARLHGGYDHPVSERGRSLSAGQRQLIALARAQLVDPAVLILDEATSNLDLATEARVSRAMQAVAAGRTTLVIAHRLPTARAADRVVVVADGRIVEQGPHDELVAAGGRYSAMWEAFDPAGEPV